MRELTTEGIGKMVVLLIERKRNDEKCDSGENNEWSGGWRWEMEMGDGEGW